MLCICARVVSTICSAQPSARAAAASFSMTCSLFFSLLLAVSMRQVDIASKASFTALRASSESAGAHVGLKLRGVTSAYLFCMAASPLTDCKDPLGGPRGQRPSSVLLKVSQWPVTAPGASLLPSSYYRRSYFGFFLFRRIEVLPAPSACPLPASQRTCARSPQHVGLMP